MDEREALHLREQVLELRVLVATVTATNVVEPADLAKEVVWTNAIVNYSPATMKRRILTGKSDCDDDTERVAPDLHDSDDVKPATQHSQAQRSGTRANDATHPP